MNCLQIRENTRRKKAILVKRTSEQVAGRSFFAHLQVVVVIVAEIHIVSAEEQVRYQCWSTGYGNADITTALYSQHWETMKRIHDATAVKN